LLARGFPGGRHERFRLASLRGHDDRLGDDPRLLDQAGLAADQIASKRQPWGSRLWTWSSSLRRTNASSGLDS